VSAPAEQDTDEQEVQRLQQIIRDRRAVLDVAKAGTAAYQSALAAVLKATVHLVNHEAGIPARRREIYSARTAVIVR
jgi:tagatose-1,6-bisphosphate aldolase non-catalytic subunit AgaZ/GatZ